MALISPFTIDDTLDPVPVGDKAFSLITMTWENLRVPACSEKRSGNRTIGLGPVPSKPNDLCLPIEDAP